MRFIVMIVCAACSAPAATGDASGSAGDSAADAAVIPPFEPGPEPTAAIDAVPGELTIFQLDLPIGISAKIGEAAIIVGPDGTIVLLDVGNTNHDNEVLDEVVRLNTKVLTAAHGFAPRTPRQVDWIVITHFHADHVGALASLLTGATPLDITHGIVHRGYVDVGEAMNPAAFETACNALRPSARDLPLCTAPALAPCAQADWVGAYPATTCPGLALGDLATDADDAAHQPSFISLGGGARLSLVGADAFFSDGQQVTPAPAFDHALNGQENARSIVGIIEHDWFRYHFAGDLTGAGDGESPDLESHLVATSAAHWYGPRGVDVVHAHHHVRKTSSNAGFVAMATPADGLSRNVIGGINEAYLGSPYIEVLAAFGDLMRLGDGWIWVTHSTVGGASHPRLDVADGRVIVQTIQHGRGYRIQAAGASLHSHAYPSVAAEP